MDKYSFLNPIDEEGMIYAQKGNKYGYIDIDQNIIIPFIYDELSLFSEGLASAKINGKYGFLNRKGKKIIDFQFDEVDGFYQSGLAIVQKNNKYGIITQKGTFIIPIVYENIFLSEKDSLICISKNKKWAFFSKKGKQVTNFIYDQITFSKKSLILIKKDKKIGYLDSNLTEKIPIGKYDYGTPFNNNGLAIVSKKNRFGVINNKDFQVIKTEFDSIGYLQEEYSDSDCFVGFKNDKLTLFDQKGNLIIEGIKDYFKDVCRLNNKVKTIYQIQKGNGLSGVIDEKGKVLIPVIYDEINRFRGDSVTTVMSKNKYGLIKSNNEIVYPINNDWILRDRDLDFYIVKKNDKAGIINKNLLPVLDFNYQDISPCHYNPKNLFIAKKNDKYGVIGLRGDIIIPFEYDELSNWVEYGPGSNYHFVTKNNKKGLITKGGKTIIPPVYDELRFINDQTIILAKNQKFGVVTIKNTLVIPFDYSKICTETFNLNLKGKEFYVQKNGKAFVIDNKNKMIRNKISAKEKELMNFEMKFLK
ncbi:WG repeat-containing protein [Flavobacterium fluvii]|uniref:WG repeat-containing protein n=1 Tax=Flavobacterium fluvii TaxID=468056 RepID=UPI00147C7B60|nr:WG repeat-containing protein [Flavobacterium fluvii]